jgi:hypothetical protein
MIDDEGRLIFDAAEARTLADRIVVTEKQLEECKNRMAKDHSGTEKLSGEWLAALVQAKLELEARLKSLRQRHAALIALRPAPKTPRELTATEQFVAACRECRTFADVMARVSLDVAMKVIDEDETLSADEFKDVGFLFENASQNTSRLALEILRARKAELVKGLAEN